MPSLVKGNFGDYLIKLVIVMSGIAPLAVGFIVRLTFFPENFTLGYVFLSLEKIGLFFGMVLLALTVFWVLDKHGIIFFSLLTLLLIGAIVLASCTYTGGVDLTSFDIPIPISISLVSIPVLIFYCVLFLFLHLVWEEWCTEFITVSVLLFAAIYAENMIVSLFALSFSLVIVATVRGYGTHGSSPCDVMIYRFGKPIRKRTLIFFIIPFIEEFRPTPEPTAPTKYYKETKEAGVIYISETIGGIAKASITGEWKSDISCHLVFTNKRLIVARKGLVGPAARMFYVIEAAVISQKDLEKQEFKQLSPESILKSHKKNFHLPYLEITKIEIDKNWGAAKLYIFTSKDIYEFKLRSIELENIENLICSFLPKTPIKKFETE